MYLFQGRKEGLSVNVCAWHQQREQRWDVNRTKAKRLFFTEHHCQCRGGAEHGSPTPQHGTMREERQKQSLSSAASTRLENQKSAPQGSWDSELSVLLICLQDFGVFVQYLIKHLGQIFRFFSHIVQSRLCNSHAPSFLKKNKALLPLRDPGKPSTMKAGRKSLALTPMASVWVRSQTCGSRGIL